jgi:pimeloyl-ACP methyl ester carboxylesterase
MSSSRRFFLISADSGQMPSPTPSPFRVSVADSVLIDLKDRLTRVRWPDEPPVEPWTTGTSVAYLTRLVDYWINDFDWRSQEAKLNAFSQFTVPLDGVDLHFIHESGRGPAPMPLLISHGWPGSVFEFYKLIPLLTDPESSGGDPADSFTVIAPSLPGFTFSFRPGQPRFGVVEIADMFVRLMSNVLGYDRFGAQGGDWGASVTTRIAHSYPDRVVGIHLNLLSLRRQPGGIPNPTPEEEVYLDQLNNWVNEETGYQWIQGTKPQTLAFALTDSPVGLAAWLVEKFRTMTDCDGDPENSLARDEMLTAIMLYWVTGAIGSSFWPYYARMHGPWQLPDGAVITAPTGYAEFPKEVLLPPRSVAESLYVNIQRWTPMERGGHFAALEEPEALAREIREFFRPLRG